MKTIGVFTIVVVYAFTTTSQKGNLKNYVKHRKKEEYEP
jgi:hypothetical protein